MKLSRIAVLASGIMAATAAPAFAHTGTATTTDGGFAAGFLHPLLGIDHLLAMFAVGLLSARNDGRGRWLLPFVFLAGMTAGGLAGLAGTTVGGSEYLIAASVVFVGTAVALNRKTRPAFAAVAVATVAAVHGHAHGAEVPAAASTVLYVAGFLLGTALLLLAGVAVGRWALRQRYGAAGLRWSGAAVAAAGVLVGLAIES